MTALIAFASLLPVPWKNGAGSTVDIAIEPPGATLHDFDWRISLASIAQDGPFSLFPGVDRTLALVAGPDPGPGPGLVLDVDRRQRFVLGERDKVIEFAGESSVHASLAGAGATAFNVMTRRAACRHTFGCRRLAGKAVFAPRGARCVLFLADGEALSASSDAERIGLVRFDAVVFDAATPWTLDAPGATIFIVDIFPASAGADADADASGSDDGDGDGDGDGQP